VGLHHPVVLLGSCFAINIGRFLIDYKFNTTLNPFGVLFNPHSIGKVLRVAAGVGEFSKDHFIEREGLWLHYDVHSDLHARTQEELQGKMEDATALLAARLRQARLIVLSLGSALVYDLKSTRHTVANCHKIPADQFTKRALSVQEISDDFRATLAAVRQVNPEVSFLITVSPVRHIKDSLARNSYSKALLRVAAEELAATLPGVFYFPSYEIMLDDLRDYRFYESDMLHPSQQAIDYIWQHFSQTYFEADTLQFIKDWSAIRKAVLHRPFHAQSAAHRTFVQKTIAELERFKGVVDIQPELETLKNQIQ
jgi:hypothetical protein